MVTLNVLNFNYAHHQFGTEVEIAMGVNAPQGSVRWEGLGWGGGYNWLLQRSSEEWKYAKVPEIPFAKLTGESFRSTAPPN